MLAHFPFGDVAGMKLRPVLLLTPEVGAQREVLAAYISSVVPQNPLPSDLVLDPATVEHRSTGLKVRSVLRLHKLATVHALSLVRYLGRLDGALLDIVDQKLRSLLSL